MHRRLISAVMLTSISLTWAQAVSRPQGKAPYTVYLAAVPDPDLVGKNVDVMSRIITSNSAVAPLEKTVLQDVQLLSIEDSGPGQSDRSAVLVLTPDEAKKLDKVTDKVGVDLVIRRRR